MSKNKVKAAMLRLLVLIVVCYAAIMLLMYIFQRSLLYFPTQPNNTFEQQPISFNHQGQSLKGWVLNPGKAHALLYFGGNAEQIEQNGALFEKHLSNYTVYLINYRGYGQSSGEPTELGLFADALYIYDQIHHKHQQVSAMGRSLGTGVAVHLAANRTIDQLVLVTPYDSISNVAQQVYKFFPVSILLKDKYESYKLVDKITAKTLLLIAQFDQVVPPIHAEELASHFNAELVTALTINDASHNDISYYPQFKSALSAFMKTD